MLHSMHVLLNHGQLPSMGLMNDVWSSVNLTVSQFISS